MTENVPYTKLTEPPKTVKEAIDWILRVARKDYMYKDYNTASFCDSLKKLLGNSNTIIENSKFSELTSALQEFIGWTNKSSASDSITGEITTNSKGIGKPNNSSDGYESAYKNDAFWSCNWQSCQSAKYYSNKCCGDSNGERGCGQCQQGQDCPAGGCCARCPEAICARIFFLIIPVLRNVLEFLQNKIGSNGWTGKINDGGICTFLTACGFNKEKHLNENKRGDDIKSQLQTVVEKLGKVNDDLAKALKEDQANGKFLHCATPPVSNGNPATLASLTDILLWLQFLPYCSEYKKVLTKVNTLLKGNGAAQSNGVGTKLDDLISSLPMMFLFVEGGDNKGPGSSGTHNGISLFQKIGTLSTCQYIYNEKYYEPDKAAKIMLSALPILHWSFGKLNEKCESGKSSAIADSSDTKKFLESLGWKESSGSSTGPTIQGKMQCASFNKYLESTLVGDRKAFNSIKDTLETAWKSETHPTSGSAFPSSSARDPQTIREMLLWLQCLPTSGALDQLKSKVKGEKHGDVDAVMRSFTDILFKIPSLYYALDGNINVLLTDLFKHRGLTLTGTPNMQFSYDHSKILEAFSAIVSILYMAFRYMQQRCNDNGDWKDLHLDGTGKMPSGGVDKGDLKNFLTLIGFDNMTPADGKMKGSAFKAAVLDTCFGNLTQDNDDDKLKKLYKCALEYFMKQHSSVDPSQLKSPSTIRQMMLWLIGLPLTKQYNALTKDNGKLSEQEIEKVVADKSSITSVNIQENILTSASGLAVAMMVIEGNATSVLEFLKGGFNDDNNSFSYGHTQDQVKNCFELLKDYSYKVHCQLRFLHYMAQETSGNGGWKECKYGNGGKQGSGKCQDCAVKTSCLVQFLEGTDQDLDSGRSPGQDENQFLGLVTSSKDSSLKDVGMGFQGKLNGSQKRTGNDIQRVLSHVCHTDKVKPLTNLLEYIVTIEQREPTTLGDCFELFKQFTCTKQKDLWSHRNIVGNGNQLNINQRLTEELKILKGTEKSSTEYVNELKNAIRSLYPENHNGNHSQPKNDLSSLSCAVSPANNSCAPYIRPICISVWSSYAPKIEDSDTDNNGFHTLQWLYDMCYRLLQGLQQLRTAFDRCSCCSVGSCGKSMVECQKAAPMFYRQGLTFHTPSNLKNSNKNCQGFMNLLKQITAVNNPLFKVFEKIVEVVYQILLQKALNSVDMKVRGFTVGRDGKRIVQSSNEELTRKFTEYIKNAMKASDGKLNCELLCKLFKKNTKCNKHGDISITKQQQAIDVNESDVVSISPSITTYKAKYIDCYAYKLYKEKGVTNVAGQLVSENTYTFKHAINFHVEKAQCVTPSPVALRSVIDWLLRVTVGKVVKEKKGGWDLNNENIKSITNALVNVFEESGRKNMDYKKLQSYVPSLVDGLREFMGYKDERENVIKKVKKNRENAKAEVEKGIQAIDGFLRGKQIFADEMGRALQKGTYKENNGTEKYFKTLVSALQNKLSKEHEGCNSYLNCININSSSIPYSNGVTADGLKQLHEFLERIKKFAEKWKEIGSENGEQILQKQKSEAVKLIKCNGSSLNNGEYFTKLYEALEKLGDCTTLISDLDNRVNALKNSVDYRNKIGDLIKKLNEDVLSMLTDPKDADPNKSDPSYAVKACEELIKLTKNYVESEITNEMKKGVEGKYIGSNGNCSAQVSVPHNHQNLDEYLCVSTLVNQVIEDINNKMEKYKEHLDDLKLLCQWLHRMGQLYKEGLQGFVKSLIEHLEHIIQVIKWLEGIEKMVTKLKDIGTKDGVTQEINELNGLSPCCQNSGHGSLYNGSKFTNRDKFFTALNCRIDHLLGSYILQNSNTVSEDKSEQRRQFLTELRLLALDRYTLQVWQDECTSGECQIKDWITFENGIVRHSDLDAVKIALQTLTGIAYNKSSPDSHSPTNRIHDFHAICVIQKFSYEAPITQLEGSLRQLRGIKNKLNEMKGQCDQNGGTQLQRANEITSFCKLVDAFLKEPYGVYQFAKFLHTILGPNIFSAVIGALEELTTDKLNENDNKNKFCGIVNVMHYGFNSDSSYKLESVIARVYSFILTLKKEYIFSYPVVSNTVQRLPAYASNSQRDPLPMVPHCISTAHQDSSMCSACYPYLAKVFIGIIPNLYRHCRMLYEMCQPGEKWNNNALTYSYNGNLMYHVGFLSLAGYFSGVGYTLAPDENPFYPRDAYYELQYSSHGNQLHENLQNIVSIKDPFKEAFDSSLKPLDQLFKAVMQHFREERKRKIEKRIEDLEDKFKNDPKNAGLKFSPPPATLPSTVRQVLFWLHELDTQADFYDGMSLHIDTLCNENRIGISHETILHVLKMSASQALEVLATIEDPGRQFPTYLYDLYTEEHYYAYPTVNVSLFFYTFVEKLMAAFLELNFVCVQCQFRALEGGWSECLFYGEDTVASRYKRGVKCECRPSFVGYTCSKPLSAFLFSDPKNQLKVPADPNSRLPYMSKGTMPCGFQLTKAKDTDAKSSTAKSSPVTGSVLVEPLRKLVGGHVNGRLGGSTTNSLSTVIYLRELLRYTLCLAVRPPWSMSENMAFFYRVTESWRNKGVRSVAQGNPKLLDGIHAEISLFPGTFDGELLTKAVELFAGLADKDPEKKHETAASPPSLTNSHQYDLRTLMGCKDDNRDPNVKCSPYIFPLSLDVYTHYNEKNSRAYLSWILNFAFGIYGQLKAMEQRITEQKCYSSGCDSLPKCPGVLTALYQSGSSFMDQGQLAKKDTNTGSTKTCSDFHTVLSGFFHCNTNSDPAYCTPLHNLILQCEAFLWSIRFPFSLIQLSLWSVAVLFVSYVFVVPLDHFKIQSHLFNRLKYTMHPSLLVSDGQRRLSEVAYFAL